MIRIRHAVVTALPDPTHVTVKLDGARVNVVILANLAPAVGRTVTVLQEGRRLVAIAVMPT